MKQASLNKRRMDYISIKLLWESLFFYEYFIENVYYYTVWCLISLRCRGFKGSWVFLVACSAFKIWLKDSRLVLIKNDGFV